MDKTLEEVNASLKLTSLWDRDRYLKRFKSDLADILELKAKGITQVWEYSDYCEDIDVNIEKRKAVIASCENEIAHIMNVMGIIHTPLVLVKVSHECKPCEGTGNESNDHGANCSHCGGLGEITTLEELEEA
jgi:hypothetical protein